VKFEAPRGTHDVLPDDSRRWELVVTTAEELCERYGYRRIVTPTFEDLGLFARTAGTGSDVVQKEMYAFTDRSGRELALRPEATAGVARAYVEHGMHRRPQPVKTFSIGQMFRYSTPQKGRYREFWQINVEAMGSADPAVDAELIQLYHAFLRKLGIQDYTLQRNSIGDRECRPAYLERLDAWLDEHEAELDAETRAKRKTSPLRVFDTKSEVMQRILATAPKIGDSLCEACRDHFAAVRAYLDAYGVGYELAPTLVRGLDYYTRTAWEFVSEDIGAQSSICGGGRYDYLIEEIGGAPTPGVGWAAGVERILLSLGEVGAEQGIEVFFITGEGTDLESRSAFLGEMTKLRAQGFRCDADYAGRSLRGAATQANRLGARHVYTIHHGQVLFFDRGTGLEEVLRVPVDGIAEHFLERARA
jgi:histidyl-tRNA synthetase